MMCRQPLKLRLEKKSKYNVATAQGKGYASVPCGQCLNCRINQSRIWTSRILLEQIMHGDCCFVTLTYDVENLPDPPHLNKKHLQDYLKRIRYHVNPTRFRYFGVGEYGDRTFRPHYHVILFGLGMMSEDVIKNNWHYCDREIGIHVGELNKDSARYITGYVVKKIQKIKGEHPVCYGKTDEFMISSRSNGGIGKPAIEKIAKKLENNRFWKGRNLRTLRIGARKQPIGRYLTRKFMQELEIDETESIVHFWANQYLHYSDCGDKPDINTKRIIEGRRSL